MSRLPAGLGRRDARAAQQRADAGLELEYVEGLGYIVIRPGLEAEQLVGILAAGREHDYGYG